MDVEKLSEKMKENAQPATEPMPTEETAKVKATASPKALTMKQRLEQLESYTVQNFQRIGEFLTKLEPLTKAIEASTSQQAAPSQGGNSSVGLGSILQFLPQILGGGGSSNQLGDDLTKKVLDAGLDQMFAGTQLLKAIQTKMMTEMGVKAVTQTLTSA